MYEYRYRLKTTACSISKWPLVHKNTFKHSVTSKFWENINVFYCFRFFKLFAMLFIANKILNLIWFWDLYYLLNVGWVQLFSSFPIYSLTLLFTDSIKYYFPLSGLLVFYYKYINNVGLENWNILLLNWRLSFQSQWDPNINLYVTCSFM